MILVMTNHTCFRVGCHKLFGFGHNADLIEDQVDALWTQTCSVVDSLESYALPLVACGSPNGAGV
jgi:hypothetical protein